MGFIQQPSSKGRIVLLHSLPSPTPPQTPEEACSADLRTYQDVGGRLGDGRQYVDTLGWEVTSPAGRDALTVTPARVHHRFTILLFEDDEVTFLKAQER